MSAWWLSVPAFAIFCVGSFCTYSKDVRESFFFIPISITLAILSGWIWAVAARKVDGTANLMLLSLVWDLLMVFAYYAGPLLFKGEKFGWQTYAAVAITIAGIIWFKLSTEH